MAKQYPVKTCRIMAAENDMELVGNAADGVIYFKFGFCFTGLDENMKRSDRT